MKGQVVRKGKNYILIGVGISFFAAVCCVTVFFLSKNPNLVELLGVFFSGLAFTGVVITVLMQKEELELQREEMRKQVEALKSQQAEMENQKEEMRRQTKTQNRQRFENMFTFLLQTQSEVRRNLKPNLFKSIYTTTLGDVNGMKKEEAQNQGFINFDDPVAVDYKYRQIVLHLERLILPAFRERCREDQQDIDHYFRHLLVIIDHILTTTADISKVRCFQILKAQFSEHELLCLFYYGLTDNGKKDDFKAKLEQARLLDDLNTDLLFCGLADWNHYTFKPAADRSLGAFIRDKMGLDL